jgi:leucyl aminopeptidase
MKFHVVDHPPKKLFPKTVLVLHVTQGDAKLPSMAAWIDKETGGQLRRELKRRKFSGATRTSTLIHSKYGPTLLVGVGKRPVDLDRIRQAAATAVQQARAHHYEVIATPATGGKRLAHDAVAQAIVEGALLGDYQFDKHRTPSQRPALQCYLTQAGKQAAAIKRGVTKGTVLAGAQILARNLANEPASHLTPKQFAAEARAVARKNGLGVSVLGPAELKRAGFGATLAVAKGSDEPPQLIKLTYRPKGAKPKKHVVLVGKSITYDSGGLNIKPTRGGSMELMKLDMSGGAAVLGAMSALKRLGVKHAVTGYLPATENLVGGSAYKPGDVVKTVNGKTIEVGNTDAEGRLTLADALAYATAKDKPDEIIDLATLTATDTALGPSYAAIFATKPKMEERLREAGERTGEKLWPLPFPEEYNDMTKSSVADFSNIVPGRAYTLSGPLLLRHFVGKVPWVHLDIGGPAMAERESGYTKKGGSGFGTRLLLEYLQSA